MLGQQRAKRWEPRLGTVTCGEAVLALDYGTHNLAWHRTAQFDP